jgi:hypothetical protein
VDVCDLSAADRALALRRRTFSAVEALEAVLERADSIADSVNPFTMGLDDRARSVFPSVPNVLGHAAGYEGLIALAAAASLGDDLVVQLPYGDSEEMEV